jgi:hypothetical protein
MKKLTDFLKMFYTSIVSSAGSVQERTGFSAGKVLADFT